MNRREPRERGVYLLEVGASIVGVALFMLAVGDATRLYQARSAVRAAVHEGLRCLYPTDAGCSQTIAGTASPAERRFDVFVSNVADGYRVAQETLRFGASWLMAPVFEVPLTTTSVTSVVVQTERDRFVRQEVLFPVSAHLPYVFQKRPLPRVAGADPLRPAFFHPGTGDSMSPNLRISLSGIKGVTRSTAANRDDEYNSRFKIGERSFSVSDAWSSYDSDSAVIRQLEKRHNIAVQCYQGKLSARGLIRWGTPPAPSVCSYRKSSNTLFKGNELHVPIMFHISGQVTGAEAGAEGKVLISISWDGKTRKLGGRVLSPGGSGNFVVRGATWSDIRDDAEGAYRLGGRYEREIDLHGTLETIPLDARVTLTVTLVSLNGKSIGWVGGTMALFFPVFDFVDQAFTCGYSSDPNRCIDPPQGVPIAYSQVDKDRELTLREVDNGECSQVTPPLLEMDPGSRLSALKGRIHRGLSVAPLTMTVRNPGGVNGCSPISRTVGCNAQIATGVLQGCEESYDKARIPALCALDLRNGRDSVIGVTLGRSPRDSKARFAACTGTQIPQCARPYAREVDQVVLGDAESAQNCSEARTSSTPPLSTGPVDVSTCEDNSLERAAEYRRAHRIPPSVTVTVDRYPAPDRLTVEPPRSSCLRTAAAAVRAGEIACGHNVTWAEVQRCCHESDGLCRSEEIVGDPLGGGTAGNQTALVDAAVQRAVKTVQAVYPAARGAGECEQGSVDCLEVQGGFTDSDTNVFMSARMAVPLMILQPFGAAGVVVEHSAERASERALLWQ